jgi:hypothetical protein
VEETWPEAGAEAAEEAEAGEVDFLVIMLHTASHY